MPLGDTSGFQLAFAVDPAETAGDVVATSMQVLPVNSESISTSLNTEISGAMVGSRQTADSRVVKGSNGGSITGDISYGRFDDLLAGAFQSAWVNDASVITHTEDWLMNGETRKKFVIERRNRNANDAGTLFNYYERSFGMQVDSIAIKLVPNKLAEVTVNFLGTTAESSKADASGNPLAGKITSVISYTAADTNLLIDGSNSLKSVVLKNSAGVDVKAVVSDMTITISNALRERPALGSLYSAEPGTGIFNVEIDMSLYFKDYLVKEDFYADKALTLTVGIEDDETTPNKYNIEFGRLKVQSDEVNAGGQSQDLVETVKLQAFPFDKTVDSVVYNCTMAMQRIPNA